MIILPSSATAFSPGHLSGYFRPVYGPDPAHTGSLGAGIVIREGVTTTIWPSDDTEVTVERRDPVSGKTIGKFFTSPPIHYLLERLGVTARVKTVCSLPIGAGFGLSAAALLSTATAANALFCLSLDATECGALAHEAEIVHKTGLGDIAACMGGGRDCRKGAGIMADIEREHDIPASLCAVVFGPLPSPEVLGSPAAMARVISAFPGRCPEDTADFFRLSRRFTEESGLATPEVLSALAACDEAGIPATMTMLGNGVFASGDGAFSLLSRLGEAFLLHPADGGVRLLEVVE
ncbi:MAG: Pantoate kinase [Methanoregulaceae archaeon PtaB.Bin056]|nr:MAG: Pantoate kinase [Methanoregulaceae archaeon PtaB.Bin056]